MPVAGVGLDQPALGDTVRVGPCGVLVDVIGGGGSGCSRSGII